MAYVDWTEQALDALARHDAWRVNHHWEPIYAAVESFFTPHNPTEPPYFLPGKAARRLGEPVDLRMVFIIVRSKPFQVFFRYADHVFEIHRVYHPRAS